MLTKRSVQLLLMSALALTAGCAADTGVGLADGAIADCEDGSSDERCEGSSHEPGDDGAVDEAPMDGGDGDRPDAAGDGDADGDGDGDDGSVDGEPDADVEPDGGRDADVVAPPANCRDDYACGYGACLEAEEPPVCECAAGYRDDGAGCTWAGDGATGGVSDPDLNDPAAWSGARVAIADGLATFQVTGSGESCEIGVLQQLIQMPQQHEAQRFVVELDVRSPCASSDPEACPGLQLELGTSATRLVVAGAPEAATAPVARTVAACVGQAGYGRDVALRVRPSLTYQHGELPVACETAAWPAIDRIAIRPAEEGECAGDDALLGGLGSSAGWTLADAAVAGDTLVIAEGGRAETAVAFSGAAEHQALHIRTVAPPPRTQQVVDFALDGLSWGRLHVSGEATLCMPEWAAGASHQLAITSLTREAVITELAIVSAEACGDNAFDMHFDRPAIGSSWSTSDGIFGAVSGYEGNGLGIAASGSLLASLRFPAREPAYRFALHARYRNMAPQTAAIDFALDASSGESTNAGGWQSRVACLPNRFEHQLVTLKLDVEMTPMAAGGDVQMSLDDLGLAHPLQSECE